MEIGEIVKKKREELGFSQRQLSYMSGVSNTEDKYFCPYYCKKTGYLFRKARENWRYCPICGTEFKIKLVGSKQLYDYSVIKDEKAPG